MKRKINMEDYSRELQFNVYKKFDNPMFSMTYNIDITKIYEFAKENNFKVYNTVMYCISEAINLIPEFKQRVENNELVEYDEIGIGFTVLKDDETFNYAYIERNNKFEVYHDELNKVIEKSKFEDQLKDKTKEQSNLIYFSSIPWISFTSITNPINLKDDYIPRICIGKFFDQDNKKYMPIGIQCNHTLIDGIHIAKFNNELYKIIEDLV